MPLIVAVAWGSWLIAGAAIVLVVALLLVAWWALSGDPPRGRRRCPRCWYDVTHSTGMRCPECGYTGAEKSFLRRRRRPVLAVLAMIGCAGASLWLIDRAQHVQWTSLVPTRTLITLVAWSDRPQSAVHTDLRRRMAAGQLTDAHWTALARRCVTGDPGERPPDAAWETKYGAILERAARRDQRTVEQLLEQIPPRVEARLPEGWPADAAPVLGVYLETWWPDGESRVRTEPKLPGATATVHRLSRRPIQDRSYSIELPRLDAGVTHVELDLAFERRRAADDPWTVAHRATLRVPIEIVDTDPLQPISTPALDDAVRRVVSAGLRHFSSGDLPVRVGLDYRAAASQAFAGTAIGLRIDVLRNGELGRQLDIWWLAERPRASWEVPFHDNAVLAPPPTPEDEWTVRARSVRELAMRVRGAETYWEGEVTTPVRVRSSAQPAPARGWIEETTAGP